MAGSSGDLDIKITGDASEVTAAMTETRSQLDQTITTIQVQDQSWRSLAVSVTNAAASAAPAVAQITTAIAGLAGTVAVINHQRAMLTTLMSPLQAAGSAFITYGGLAARGLGMIVPQWKLVTTAVSVGLLVYKAATSEMAESAYKAAKGNADIEASAGRLQTAFSGLGAALSEPFGKAAQGAKSLFDSINPLPYLFGSLTATASGWIDNLAAGVESLTPKVVAFTDTLATIAFVTSSLGTATADSTAKFYEEAAALRASAKASEIRIAAQEAQRPLFKQLGEMQDSARESAQRTEEAARVGSLNTVAAIDEEIRALQAKAAQAILTGDAVKQSQQAAMLQNTAKELKVAADAPKASADDKKAYADAQAAADAYTKPLEEAAKQQARLFAILEERKAGIESGRIKLPESNVDSAIAASRMELLKLTEGEDAAAVAAMRLKASTDDERAAIEASIPAFLAAREAVREASKAKDEQKLIADLLKKSADEEAATQKRAADQIAALSDKINILNGSATSAEVAMRQLSSQGFNAEAATQISGLNAELERLNQAKSATDKVTSLKDQIDLLSGTATSAEITMRELGRAGFTADQVAEIGALTEQLDALRESQKKQPKGKAEKDDSPTVALQGSKEAAEIMLRGVGGGSKLERLGESQLATLQRIATAVSAKPATQQPPTNPQPQQQQPQMVAKPAPFALPPAPVFSMPVIPPLPEQPEPPKPQPVPVAVQAQPQPAISSRPIPIQSPIVARSVLPTPVPAQIPTPQVVEPQPEPEPQPQPQPVVQQKTSAEKLAAAQAKQDQLDEAATQARWNVPVWKTATGMLGGALLGHPLDGMANADSQDPAVDKAEAAAEAHRNNWNRKQGEYAPPNAVQIAAAQPAQVPSVLPSSGPVEPAVRPVGVPDAIPSAPEVRNFTIANVPVTKPLADAPRNVQQQQAIATPQPAPPSMPNWEQHAFDVQQSLVSGLSDGPRLSADDDNVPIDQVAFPDTSFKPNVAAIDIPSPVVNVPEVSAVNVPSPLVNVGSPSVSVPGTPNIPAVSIPSPAIQAPAIEPIKVPAPVVNPPTMSPIAMESPSVNVPQTPSITIPAPNVTAPKAEQVDIPPPVVSPIAIQPPLVMSTKTPAIAIPSPNISAPAPSRVSIPAPSVTAANPQPISIPAPQINSPQVPDVSIPSPSVNLANTPPINVAPPEVSIAPLPLRAITLDAPEVSVAGLSPITIPARQEQPTPQPTINTVSKPSIVPTVASPTFSQTPVPTIPELTIPTPKMPSLSIPELPRAKPPSLEKFSGMSTRVEASLRSGPSNEASNLRNLEKLAASQLAEMKNHTAAVKANKPQPLAAGSV